jgi:hypothetical protein
MNFSTSHYWQAIITVQTLQKSIDCKVFILLHRRYTCMGWFDFRITAAIVTRHLTQPLRPVAQGLPRYLVQNSESCKDTLM